MAGILIFGNDGLQALARAHQLLFQTHDQHHVGFYRFIGHGQFQHIGALSGYKDHFHMPWGKARFRNGSNMQMYEMQRLSAFNVQSPGNRTFAFVKCLIERRAQIEPQVGQNALEDVLRDGALRLYQIATDVTKKVRDLIIGVHQQARRRVDAQRPFGIELFQRVGSGGFGGTVGAGIAYRQSRCGCRR